MTSIRDIINTVFPSDGIYEVILGTNGKKLNLSPIGIVKEGDILKSKIYQNTMTFSNLLHYPKCSINIINDADLFFDSFFGNLIPDSFYENVPVIERGLALIADCYYERIDDPTFFFYNIKSYKKFEENIYAFNRGNSMLIDLLVHVSRLDIYSKEELEKYIPIIKYEIEIIRKTSPKSIKKISKIEELLLQKGLKI